MMFLKQIEMKGFKSFADSICIELEQGINAVVGPNGSGKSNIADAIRWVLGEQSVRTLRGSKMEDVIFSGSNSRRAVNRAEVTLLFHNEDGQLPIEYSEVSVTRRLYRSGESEYLLNKKPCRRKDIIELFLDTGLSKQAFSIIGQGQVEEVLTSKPEERRMMFDEASGVLKYKERKREAEKKLAETNDNLARVHDILHELESQLEPLQIQSSIAKDYLEKEEELKAYDIQYVVWEIQEKHTKWEKIKAELSYLEEEREKVSASLQQVQEELKEEEKKAEEREQQIARVQEELVTMTEQMEKQEGEQRLIQEQSKHTKEQLADYEERLQQVKEKQKEIQSALSQEKQCVQTSKQETEALKKKLRTIEKERKEAEVTNDEKVERLKGEYIERLNERAALRNEIRLLEDQKVQLDRKIRRLKEENNTLIEARQQTEEAYEQMKEKERAFLLQYEREKEIYAQCVKEEVAIRKLVNEEEKKLYDAYRYLDQMQSRIEMLEEMEASYAGFFHGVKAVLQEKGKSLQGIVGAVPELLEVEKRYVTAIETALGGAMQHIVTETERDAQQAIQFLKKGKKGRATFLPTNVIKPRRLRREHLLKIEKDAGFVAIAKDLVRIPKRYQNIGDYLLGQVVVAKTLEDANRLGRFCNYEVKIVTLDGELLHAGGSMTGGVGKKDRAQVLERQTELKTLKEKRASFQAKTLAFEKEVANRKKQWQQLQVKVQEWQERLEEIKSTWEQWKQQLIVQEGEVSQASSRLALFDKEHEALQKERNELEEKISSLKKQLHTIQKEIDEMNDTIQSLEENEKERKDRLHDVKEEEMRVKVQWTKAKEALTYHEAEVTRLRKQLAEYKEQIVQLKKEKERLQGKSEQLTSSSARLPEKIEMLAQKKQEWTEKMALLRRDKVEALDRMEELKQAIQIQTETFEERKERIHELQVAFERLDVELDTKLRYLEENYEITFERAKSNYQMTMPPEEVKKKIVLVKREMAELGPVNIGAIEEYERIDERVSFLKAQEKDLLEAKEALFQVIEEMDEEMKRRFSTTYQAIRKHFKVIFQELFGGGDADVYLTNEDELLTSGVDLIARPPGKKRQHLSLLSGGEKSLTAIALLFAVMKVRPAPFCVLDEAEAALDEANVKRFASYLRTFRERMQCIVITHRKTTMEEADVLYGVTMEEEGVSKIVSVKLEDAKEVAQEATATGVK